MASIKVLHLFQKELDAVLDYGLQEFGMVAVKRFFKEYNDTRKRLAKHPLSSSREPALKNFLRPYRSTIIRNNWKIIYRYDEQNDRVIFIDLWDMRRHPRTLLRQFKRKL